MGDKKVQMPTLRKHKRRQGKWTYEDPSSKRVKESKILVVAGGLGVRGAVKKWCKHKGKKVAIALVNKVKRQLRPEESSDDEKDEGDVRLVERQSNELRSELYEKEPNVPSEENGGELCFPEEEGEDIGIGSIKKSGCILVNYNIYGLVKIDNASHGYMASKNGVLGLIKSVVVELGKVGIRVKAISCYGIVLSYSFESYDKLSPFTPFISETS
eukprot:Gb_30465 [translate_table: standard]